MAKQNASEELAERVTAMLDSKSTAVQRRLDRRAGKNSHPGHRHAVAMALVLEDDPELARRYSRDFG